MKKFFFLIFLFFYSSNLNADVNIVFIDMKFIINNSELGKYYNKILKNKEDKIKDSLKKTQNSLKKQETEIKNQKNILSEDQLNTKISSLNKLFLEYQQEKQNITKKFNDEKNQYTEKLLGYLNPIITNYIEEKKIDLVIEKKNILIGIRTLEITKEILNNFDLYTKKNNLINE